LSGTRKAFILRQVRIGSIVEVKRIKEPSSMRIVYRPERGLTRMLVCDVKQRDDRCDPHCNTGGRFYRSSHILGQLKEEAGKQKDLVVICTNPAAPPNAHSLRPPCITLVLR